MLVHAIADTRGKLTALSTMLARKCTVTSDLLGRIDRPRRDVDAIVVAADLGLVDNITALKAVSKMMACVPRRIFLIEGRGRLAIVQAYALGATHVLSGPVSEMQLLAKLANASAAVSLQSPGADARYAASTGAASLASMFSAVMTASPIDIDGVKAAGSRITDAISETGLTDWLATVRRHHEGTYQHCLLVTGIAVDFGLSLGLLRPDIERLYCAAMFHDIGKAWIPLTILDKPGHLDDRERTLVEMHPVAGYEALKGTSGISTEVLDAVRHHHEYLDGSGYPDGLSADSISDIVRILTISDIFAALIEHRSYKPTMSREAAYELLSSMHGKLEMPLVEAFREVALNR